MKLLTIGGATQDAIADYGNRKKPVFPWKEGSKIEVEKFHYTTGGGATNSAVSLKKLGHEVSTIISIGNDAKGQELLKDLAAYALNLVPVMQDNKETGVSFIVPTEHKDRIIFSCHGANEQLTQQAISKELIALHDCIYISPLHGQSAQLLPYITHIARTKIDSAQKYKVAVNPGSSQLHEEFSSLKGSLSEIDILMSNTEEMKLIMSGLKNNNFISSGKQLIVDGPPLMRSVLAGDKISFTVREYFTELFSYGIKRIVVTDGKNGVYVATKDTLYFHPSMTVPVTNTLGAGDAFCSTFVGLLMLGHHVEYALRGGVLNAASVIQKIGAKTGLLTLKELDAQIKTLPQKSLQTFPLT